MDEKRPNRLLTVTDVAERLRVGVPTVRSWIHWKELDAIDVAPSGCKRKFFRITEEALAEFEARRRTKAPVVQRPQLPPFRKIV